MGAGTLSHRHMAAGAGAQGQVLQTDDSGGEGRRVVSSRSGPWSPSITRSHTHLQTCPPLRAWQLPSRVPEAPSWAFLFSPTEQTHCREGASRTRGVGQGCSPRPHDRGVGAGGEEGDSYVQRGSPRDSPSASTCQPPRCCRCDASGQVSPCDRVSLRGLSTSPRTCHSRPSVRPRRCAHCPERQATCASHSSPGRQDAPVSTRARTGL